MEKKYNEIFKGVYNGQNIEESIQILKNAGATQLDTLKVIMDELHLSIPEADDIVLNADAWKKNKKYTEYIRESFYDVIKNHPREN